MLLTDHLARSSTIAILVVMAVVLGREHRRIPSARVGIAFFFTIAAHLVLTWPGYVGPGGLHATLKTAALAAPATFFLFTRALFDDEGGFTWRDGSLIALLVAVGWIGGTRTPDVATFLYYACGLALVLVALGRVVRGFPSDLVEPRRRLRAVFTLLVGLQILVVISVEILLPVERRTQALETLKSSAALLLTASFTIWFLTPRRELFAAEPLASSTASMMQSTATLVSEDARSRERLLSLMEREHAYRQEGLTIALLAQKLDIPEYRLRRIINQQLGYRNFNAFLNDVRIEEACRILADPAHERLPILNLALDLGYGSPGPFNRAFRARMGQTPTEYRRSKLGSSSSSA